MRCEPVSLNLTKAIERSNPTASRGADGERGETQHAVCAFRGAVGDRAAPVDDRYLLFVHPGHRICVMRDGLIMRVADPLTLYRQPDNLFVAGFIGSPPMNLLNGKVQKRPGGLHFAETASRFSDR